MVKVEEYITKKLPRRINGGLRRLQARYQLRYKKRISEGRLLEMLVDYGLKNESRILGKKKGKISSIFGLYTTKEKVNSVKEIDSVVYGV
ncbi:MAG: hypothetical protein V1909_01745 [Candidatus Micrarchaeota archaeon]